jgi:ABC-2 type transport system permease protein
MQKTEGLPIYDSVRQGSVAFEELAEIFRYRDLVIQIVRRDLLTRYKRSVLGVAWTMLNPLGMMIVLSIAFSSAFGIKQEGYAAYVLSGLIAWNFFSQTTNAATSHLVWGGSLLRRIYVPRTVFAVAAVGTGLINLLLSVLPLLLVMLVTRITIKPTVVLLPLPIIFLALFSLGMGLLVSSIAVFFADVAEMYQIVLTAWMYLTPIIYPESMLPEIYRVWIARLNPMYHLVELFRMPVFDGVVPPLPEVLISAGVSIAVLIIGWIIFTRRADEFAYRV